MAKYLVRCDVSFSSIIDADSPESAIDNAPCLPDFGEWESRDASDYEAEEVGEK